MALEMGLTAVWREKGRDLWGKKAGGGGGGGVKAGELKALTVKLYQLPSTHARRMLA